MSRLNRIFQRTIVVIAFLELFCMLGSWVVSTVWPSLHLRSMLSDEGIRWFLGSFVANHCRPLLLHAVLIGMACGAVRGSGIIGRVRGIVKRNEKATYRDRMALMAMVAEVAFFALCMVLLTSSPHASLLSATGELWPSSFSRSLVPGFAFILMVPAWTFGLLTRRIPSLSACVGTLVEGLQWMAPLFVAYISVGQLIYTIQFIFS